MRALFSLHDTTNAVFFAKELIKLGWEIIATKETVEILEKEGIPCQDVARFVGFERKLSFPPTLHPLIEQALTEPSPENRIDMVYDIPYPIEHGNDIGGRTLLGLAVKGDRIPIISSIDMKRVIFSLKKNGFVSQDLKRDLSKKALQEIATFYFSLSNENINHDFADCVGRLKYSLLNGENPYQKADIFESNLNEDPLAISKFAILSETSPCFTNVADFDSILQTMCLACEAFLNQYGKHPFITIASKHGNPCGMSISWTDSYQTISQALFGDPIAIWGGELITNFEIDENAVESVIRSSKRDERFGNEEWMLDVVVAPSFSERALTLLRDRKFRKIFQNESLLAPRLNSSRFGYRLIRGGIIRQYPHSRVFNLSEGEFLPNSFPGEKIDDLIVAWAVSYSSFQGGNEVSLVKDNYLIGLGGGPATIYAAQTAILRAQNSGHSLEGSLFCGDAFFPFSDAPKVLIDAGVRYGCIPQGGKNEKLVRETFFNNGVQMLYLPEDFRGFCRH